MALIRMAVLGVGGIALAGLGSHVFDGRASELGIVPLLVTAIAMLTMRFGIVVRVGSLATGVIVATIVTVLSGGGTVGDVVPGVRSGLRRLLSTEWPSPLDPVMIGTVALLVGACTASALQLAHRDRWRLLPLLPIGIGAIVLIALSAPSPPPTWLVLVLGMVSVGIAALGSPSVSSAAGRQRLLLDRTVVATLVAIAVATLATASAVAWADRADPRDPDEANIRATLLDPVEATVAMREIDPPRDLMTITDRSPLARPTMPQQWRLAAFDNYDGQRWVPTVDLHAIGGRLAAPPADPDSTLVYDVAYDGDAIDLVPFPGQAIAVDRDVQTDPDRVVVRLPDRPDASTQVEAVAVPAPTLADADAVGSSMRQVDEIAEGFRDPATRIAGTAGLPLERLGRLAQTMRTEWELDPGAPGPGQQEAFLERFVETRAGTREQFVTAFALLARSIGFDTRVAAGFEVPTEELGETFSLRTEHAAIWPEVRLEDGTWLPFDPVPERAVPDADPDTPPAAAQTPAAAQPPSSPDSEDSDTDDEPIEDEPQESSGWAPWVGWVVRGAAATGVVVLPLALAIAIILVLKWRRHRARLRADDPVLRVRGAWANATDSLVDAGLKIAPSWTDERIAAQAATVVADAPREARRLAAMSAEVTYGVRTEDWSAQLAESAGTSSEAIDDAIRSSYNRWRRLRWRLSLRSLRRSTRSPVVP